MKEVKTFFSGLLYLSPALLGFIVFIFYPMLRTLYLSFFLTNPRGKPVYFNGIKNYVDLFHSSDFLISLKSTFLFILMTVPTTIIIALFLAILASEKLKGIQAFRVMYSSTIGISVAAGAVIWLFLFHPSIGLLNHTLNLLHISGVQWLTDPHWALLSISITTIWMNIGFNFIVLLGGIQNIPEDLYESAHMDGAGYFTQLFKITMPLLSPTLFFVMVVSMIQSFQSFGQIDIMTQGGPVNATNLIVYSIYRSAFINNRYGVASAQAIILFVLVLIFTLIQFKVGEKKVHYQ